MSQTKGWFTRHLPALALAILLVVPGATVTAGDITGTVDVLTASGSRAEPQSPYARQRAVPPTAQQSGGGGERVMAVVYLEDQPSLPEPDPPGEEPVMNQVDKTIVPHILPVTVGTTVRFPNSDDIYHNLFSLSPARKFDLGRYASGQEKEVTFRDVGEVRVFCDIHPHMNAVILVLPNEYYAEVGPDGSFRIEDVPAGTYRLHAWHESLQEQVITVEVPEEGEVQVKLVLGIR